VPLCKVCNSFSGSGGGGGGGKNSRGQSQRTRKAKKKARNDGWESDDGGDVVVYPKGIMKVWSNFLFFSSLLGVFLSALFLILFSSLSFFSLQKNRYGFSNLKPDITFFGEKLSAEFDRQFYNDSDTMDLLVVIGTSLKVRPVSDMLSELWFNFYFFICSN
jgi:NAD-dependent SIR2 family protein deacetylase